MPVMLPDAGQGAQGAATDSLSLLPPGEGRGEGAEAFWRPSWVNRLLAARLPAPLGRCRMDAVSYIGFSGELASSRSVLPAWDVIRNTVGRIYDSVKEPKGSRPPSGRV